MSPYFGVFPLVLSALQALRLSGTHMSPTDCKELKNANSTAL